MDISTLSRTPRSKEEDNKERILWKMREMALNVWWRVFHILISWWNQNLHQTVQSYVKKTGSIIRLSDDSRQAIESFVAWWKGAIFLHHSINCNFTDAIPMISLLWEETMQKTCIYTGTRNEDMYKNAFPHQQFSPVTMRTRDDASTIKNTIRTDLEDIQQQWWYVMVFASGVGSDWDSPHKAVAHQIIKNVPDDFPVLVCDIVFEKPVGYVDSLKHMIRKDGPRIDVSVASTHASGFRWKTGQEMREYANMLTHR